MVLKIILIFSLLALVACSTPNYVKKTEVGASSDVIELDNPYQNEIDREFSNTNKISAHSVYDSDSQIEKFKRTKTSQIVKDLSVSYKIYSVNKTQSLKSIAKSIYGDPNQWKNIYKWNMNSLNGIEDVKAGSKLKYLPLMVLNKKPSQAIKSRAPASVNTFKTYVVRDSENLGFIAEKLLGERKKWTLLRDWNKDVMPDPDKLKAGIKLKYRVPAGKP
jgi:hypothetical protein